MAGDELSVSLFFFSLSAGFVFLVITLHGWKHKFLISALWILAFGSLAIAIAWPIIRKSSSQEVADFGSEVAHNPLSLTIVALIVAVGLALYRRSNRTKLVVDEPYAYVYGADNSLRTWRIKVHNKGSSLAVNVKLKLRDISPRPRQQWNADFPYGAVQVGTSYDLNDCHINAKDDATFNILPVWAAQNGSLFTAVDSTGTGAQLHIEPDEKWTLRYEITADNSDVLPFALSVYVDAGALIVRRI